MKRIILFLLVAVMCFGMVACGSNNSTTSNTESAPEQETVEATLSKEDLLAAAENVDGYQMASDYSKNPAKAIQSYCNKTLNITGMISKVNEDHVILDSAVKVYLPIEELVDVEYGKRLSIVGVTTENTEAYAFEGGINAKVFVLNQAHITEDHFIIHGWYQGGSIGLKDENGQRIDNKLRAIKWAEGVDGTQYLNSDITVSVVMVYNYMMNDWTYSDAVVVD